MVRSGAGGRGVLAQGRKGRKNPTPKASGPVKTTREKGLKPQGKKRDGASRAISVREAP